MRIQNHQRFRKTALALALSQAMTIGPALAAVIPVSLSNGCLLNEAITSANNDNANGNGCVNGSGADTLVLDSNDQIAITQGFNNGFTAAPFITSDITINGNGSRIFRVQGSPVFRLMAVTGSGKLTINDATLEGGSLTTVGSGGAIYVDENAELVLNNTTVTNNAAVANSSRGGGLYSKGGPITLNNSHISQNRARVLGGGVALTSNNGGTLTIMNGSTISSNTAGVFGAAPLEGGFSRGGGVSSRGTFIAFDSTISNNTASFRGGGIDGRFNLVDSVVSGNLAKVGGGIYAYAGAGSRIVNSTISANTATSNQNPVPPRFCQDERLINEDLFRGYGGGLFINSARTILPELTNVTFSGNAADCGGGIALLARGSTDIDLNSSNFSQNSAVFGGGLFITSRYLDEQESASIVGGGFNGNSARYGAGVHSRNVNLTFSGFTAANNRSNSGQGGGLHLQRTQGSSKLEVNIANATISANTAGFNGGGLWANQALINLYNTTINRNQTGSPTLPISAGGMPLYSSTLTMHNTIVANSIGRDCVLRSGSAITADSSNIIEDGSCDTNAIAADPLLEQLGDNGGVNLTHALQEDSPALDAGNRVVCKNSLVANLDQRGIRRPIGDECDIGAFESSFGQGTQFFVIPLGNGRSITIPL